MVNGIINVYKEKGYTSFDVVAKLRGIFKQKKIGHTGTLDPDAEGVLPVCLGKATKVCDLLTDKSKEYETVLLLGKVTDTQDITGTVLEEKDVKVTEEAVRETVLSFVGDYMQIPPMYSALKVNGKKLCDLAREGKTVERQARPVKILTIDILDVTLPRVRMRVHCSKGTYIRTLCQDIGEKLGCGGCMESLLRTQVSEFLLKDALKIGEIGQLVQECAKELPPEAWSRACFPFVRSVDSVFTQYQKAVVPEQFAKVLYNGNRIEPEMIRSFEESMQQKPIRIYDEKDHFIGIYEFQQERGNFKPVKVKGAFWICTIALITLFSVPYLEGTAPVCTNGIYEAFCVIIAFPVLVWLGASGTTTDKKSTQICKFLGDISYPAYVIHYPFMYLFYAWLIKNQLFTLEQTWQVALCVYAWNILLAYLCLKFYDEPVRKYLARRFLSKKR
mgnify:FL=1